MLSRSWAEEVEKKGKGEGNRERGIEGKEKKEGEEGRGNRKGGEKVEGDESCTDQMLTNSITLHTVLHTELQTHNVVMSTFDVVSVPDS